MGSLLKRFPRPRKPEITEAQATAEKLAGLQAIVDFAVTCGACDIAPLLREPPGANRLTDAQIDEAGLKKAIAVATQEISKLQGRGVLIDKQGLTKLVEQRWGSRESFLF